MTVLPLRSANEPTSGWTIDSFIPLSPPDRITTSCLATSIIATALSSAACAMSNWPAARPSRWLREFSVRCSSSASPCRAKMPLAIPAWSGSAFALGKALTRTGVSSSAARPAGGASTSAASSVAITDTFRRSAGIAQSPRSSRLLCPRPSSYIANLCGSERMGKRTTMVAVLTALFAAAAARADDAVDLAAARREGSIVWYSSLPIDVAQKLATLFEEKSGIKVELFRSGGTAILRRFLQERDSGRVMADVLYTADPAATASLAHKGAFVAFKPKNFDKIDDVAKDPQGYYVALRLNMITLFVRTDEVAAADVPKSWSALTDPKYKGKLVISDPSFTAVQVAVVGTLARKLGWSYYDALRRNDIMVVPGNQQLADMLKRGERLIGAGGLDSYPFDARREGHKIVSIVPSDGGFGVPGPVAVIKGSPDPNAAKAFAAFLISDEVQQIVVADGAYSARVDLAPPAGETALKDLNLLAVDYDALEKDAPAVKKKFNEVFQ